MRPRHWALVWALCGSGCLLPTLEQADGGQGGRAQVSTIGGDTNAGGDNQSGTASLGGNVGLGGVSGSNEAGEAGNVSEVGQGGSGAESGSAVGGSFDAGGVSAVAGHRDVGGAGSGGSLGGTAAASGIAGAGGAVSGSAGTAGASGKGGGANCSQNLCTGCSVLANKPGDSCAGCGKYTCDGSEAVTCQSTCGGTKPVCDSGTNTCVTCTQDNDCKTTSLPVCLANTCVACRSPAASCQGTTPRKCNTSGGWDDQSVVAGTCGATCTPGALTCKTAVAQQCASNGVDQISSGSTTPCNCSAPGRYIKVASDVVLDTQTGLRWDFPGHAADNYANASAVCANKGMHVPTVAQLTGLLLTGSVATACGQAVSLAVDSVAFPSITAGPRYWTNQVEGIPGFMLVFYFWGPSGTPPTSGSGTTERRPDELVAYLCVK